MSLPTDASDPGGWTAAGATTTGPATTGPATAGPATTGPSPDGTAAAPLAPDDRFQGAIAAALAPTLAVERELEGGGMARVFVAREVALGRRVVVKVLPPDLAAGVNRERFRREIQLAAALQHPHIVPLLAAGEVPAPLGAFGGGPAAAPGPAAGSLYYTMPFIEGESLRAEAAARAARGQAFSPREVLRLLRDLVGALGYAHARGVVHRDVKPGNVLLQAGHALVTDFGVAKALAAALPVAAHTVTTLGMAVGTPAYMAPEQLAADPAADHRVDLYAAALVAYELLSGASPFAAASPQATLAAQLTRVPEPLGTLRPDVPPALADVVMRCLAKDPSARPATAAELLDALDAAAEGAPTPAHPVAPRAAPAAGGVTPGSAITAAVAAGGATTRAVAPHAAPLPAGPDAPTVAVGRPRRPGPRERRALAAAGAVAALAFSSWVAFGGTRGRAAGDGPASRAALASGTAAGAVAAAAPAPAAPVPALSRADSVAIAQAVARQFERAMARDAGGAAAAAGTAPAAPHRVDRGDSARQRRAAREAVADSLTRAGPWQHVPREVVRAVVGRLPVTEWPAAVSVEERRVADEALRAAQRQLHAAGVGRADGARDGAGEEASVGGPVSPPPPFAPLPPGAERMAGHLTERLGARGPWPGFTMLTANLPAPAPGVRRAVLVATADETDRPDLARLAPVLDGALRTRLRAAGRVELTDLAVGAVARHERVPDPVIARMTNADAVVRGTLRSDDETVRARLLVRGAHGAPTTVVEARAALGQGTTLAALADSLAVPLARGVAAALGGRATGAAP